MSAQFWLNLQTHYDIEIEREKLSDKLYTKVRELHLAVS